MLDTVVRSGFTVRTFVCFPAKVDVQFHIVVVLKITKFSKHMRKVLVDDDDDDYDDDEDHVTIILMLIIFYYSIQR